MKGFLHRLVAGAVRPQEKLHPLVEPIFAPRMREASMDSPAQLELTETVVAPRAVANRRVSDVITGVDAVAREASVIQSSAHVHAVRGIEPLVHVNRVAAEHEQVNVAANDGVEGRTAPVATPLMRDERRQDLNEVSQLTAEYLPLIIERLTQGPSADVNAAVSGTVQGLNENSMQASRAPRAVPKASVREQAAPVTQPDEIQIHIGRIEVIATPPPAPRVAVAPARKSMSLDEYLSRRDGRVG